LFDLIVIPDSLNVRGKCMVVELGPNEKVLISGRWDGDNWWWVRVVCNGDGSLWRVSDRLGRGDVSLITVMVLIITSGGRGLSFEEWGVLVGADMFLISMSGLLGPCIDRSITGDGGGGMNKGGGEFSWSGEGVVPVEPSCRVGDAMGVRDIVKDISVGVGWLGFWLVVECGGHV
jgi:hypothetical protein